MMERTDTIVAGLAASLLLSVAPASGQTLFGVNFNAGVLRTFDAQTGVAQVIGETGVVGLSGLDLGRDGYLYSFQNTTRDFYRIDPGTAQATFIGNMGVDFEFEGGLAIIDETTAYAVGGRNTDAGAALFRVNLTTGAATELVSLGTPDVSALTVRSDGVLVAYSHIGINFGNTELFTIDPSTLVINALAMNLGVPDGPLAGMTGDGTTGYLATTGFIPSLLTFDLYTGEVYSEIALNNFYSGIALPSPGTVAAFGLVGLVGARRRRA